MVQGSVNNKDMTNRRDVWEMMLEDFLLKLYRKSRIGISYVAREEIAKELELNNTQANDIVNELDERDCVATRSLVGTKIRITELGRNYVRDSGLDNQKF
jgi:predicted transcriptional regulator